MARVLPTLLVLALVGASAVALDRAQASRLVRTPILRSAAGTLFSPVCECPRNSVPLRFELRRPESVTVTIRRNGGDTVDTVVSRRSYPAGWVRLAWDGIQPNGIAAADGTYRPAVHLEDSHRTVVLPDAIHVDTQPPSVVGAEPKPLLLSPDGDGRGDALTVRYRLREPGRGVLLVDGRQRTAAARAGTTGRLAWNGREHGRPLPGGPHPLAFVAEDAAGNRSAPERIGTMTIRYVVLARSLVSVGPGERFYILVSADARRIAWRFAGRTGLAHPGTLVLRAPRTTGRYRLYVAAAGHADAATVKVERIR